MTGLSSWGVQLDKDTEQTGLVLGDLGDFAGDLEDETDSAKRPSLRGHVDHLEAVYLFYLLRDRDKFKTLIDAMTDKLVLILGNFSREKILDDIRQKLAELGYAPVVFDFEAPVDRDLIETVALLAGLSCFVIADLTDPRSTPLETMLVVPQFRVPFATIIKKGQEPFGMFQSLQAKYEWALPTWKYGSRRMLTEQLKARVVDRCEAMRTEARERRRKSLAR